MVSVMLSATVLVLAISVSSAAAEAALSDYDRTRQEVAKQMVEKATADFTLDPDATMAAIATSSLSFSLGVRFMPSSP